MIHPLTQNGSDIDGDNINDKFGHSVALSSNGTIMAVGAPEDDSAFNNSGQVRVYQYNGSSWSQIGGDKFDWTIGQVHLRNNFVN